MATTPVNVSISNSYNIKANKSHSKMEGIDYRHKTKLNNGNDEIFYKDQNEKVFILEAKDLPIESSWQKSIEKGNLPSTTISFDNGEAEQVTILRVDDENKTPEITKTQSKKETYSKIEPIRSKNNNEYNNSNPIKQKNKSRETNAKDVIETNGSFIGSFIEKNISGGLGLGATLGVTEVALGSALLKTSSFGIVKKAIKRVPGLAMGGYAIEKIAKNTTDDEYTAGITGGVALTFSTILINGALGRKTNMGMRAVSTLARPVNSILSISSSFVTGMLAGRMGAISAQESN